MKSPVEFKNDKRGSTCLNCEQTISPHDNYCPNCGQINNTNRISLKYYFSEYLSGFFSFDNRFFKTIIPLLFKPGKVTREFIEGKRKKYVNPFQLYLNITIIFFLLIGVFNTIDNFKEAREISISSKKDNEEISSAMDTIKNILEDSKKDSIATEPDFSLDFNYNTDSVKQSDIDSKNKKDSTISTTNKLINKISEFIDYDEKHNDIDITKALNDLGYEVNNWNIFYYSKAKNINKFMNDAAFRKSYGDHLISKISIALFFLLPIFTLIVALLYIRNKYNYSEHLVFVFHTQTVFFILLIMAMIIDRFLTSDWATSLAIFLFLYYLFVALINFYKQGWFKTFVKYLILNSFYFVLALIGGILVSFIAFII